MTTKEPSVGDVVAGRYKLEELVGRGNFGLVFRANHIHAHFPCAIKVFSPVGGADSTAEERFLREASAANRVRRGAHLHPNVVFIFDVGRDSDLGMSFLAMEWLQGETLEARLRRAPRHRISAREACDILFPLLDALTAAHNANIVHRDIKPANIFLADEPNGDVTPKLLDFGIAILPDHRSTQTNEVPGTPGYLSPESFDGPQYTTKASDIWSMGVLLFQMLTGRLPFEGETWPALMYRILTAAIPDAPFELTASVRSIIARALDRKPGDRWTSAYEFATALQRSTQPTSAPAHPVNVAIDWSDDLFLDAVNAMKARPGLRLEVWLEGGSWERSQRLLSLINGLTVVAIRIRDGAELWNGSIGPPNASTIESLDLWDVDDDALVSAFGPSLVFPHLEGLTLQPRAGTALTERGLRSIAQTQMPALSRLSIFGCALDDDALAALLPWIPQLHSLIVRNCRLSTAHVEMLVDALRNSSIRYLEIIDDSIGDETVRMLKKLPIRVSLRVSRGDRDDDSCVALCGQDPRLLLV